MSENDLSHNYVPPNSGLLMTGDYTEMDKNDIGVVWRSSNLNSKTHVFKILAENIVSTT
jgi:hypothetical protein